MNYYNEFDPHAAEWLRWLIADSEIPYGHVDTRSITEVTANDLKGYTQCHFFAGIGGWSYALQLAGWPEDRPVWTGSCPCQPFSVAGKGLGTADERHLWPVFGRLIGECNPPIVFGEQVAGAAGCNWLYGVRADLEGMGYAVGAADLCAAGVGAPHTRQRLYWVADSTMYGCERVQRRTPSQVSEDGAFETLGPWNCPSNPFTDWKKLLAGTCVRKLDDGVSSNLVVRPALRGFGNAVVPQVAQTFIEAFLEI